MFTSFRSTILGAIVLLGLAACSDVTGPGPSKFCPITGGPGTCGSVVQR